MIDKFFKNSKSKNKEAKVIVEMLAIIKVNLVGQKNLSMMRSKMVQMLLNQVYKPETITLKSNKKILVKTTGVWGKYKTLHDLYKEAHTPWEWILN